RVFYGWMIVAASLVIFSTLIGIRVTFGVFFKSLEFEFDITRAAISSIFSVHMVIYAIFAIITGWALDRYGPRIIVSFMGVFTGLSLLITSQVTSVWQMYLSYSLLLAIGMGGFIPLLMAIIPRWFDKKRGLALGIATSGFGLGPVIMAPFAAYLITNLGWRNTYIVLAVIAVIVVLSLARVFRREPGEIGALPDGIKRDIHAIGPMMDVPSIELDGLSLLQTLRRKKFWLMFCMWFFLASSNNLISTHIIPYATDVGISTIEAATIFSIMGGVQILSRLIFGRIADVAGSRIPAVISALFGAGALLWLIWSHDLMMLYLFAIFFGLAWGGLGVNILALSSELFESPNLGAIFGALEIGFALGGAA
ncbi:MAG: MFS transporter, partial [Anaerolineales bacterium]|nr:MFS transporter [Anaerolineales bacterium]